MMDKPQGCLEHSQNPMELSQLPQNLIKNPEHLMQNTLEPSQTCQDLLRDAYNPWTNWANVQ